MAKIKSQWVNGNKPMPTPSGSEVITVLLALAILAAETAADDLYVMGELPVDCVLCDVDYAATDLDTGTPAHVMSFGVLNAGETDLDTVLEAGIDVGQAGTAARMTKTVATLTTKTDGATPKKLAYKVTTASATGADGTVYANVSYRALNFGS